MAPSSSSAPLTAARGALLSIALRLASFVLSQLTVRFVSAAALGKASVPLELMLSTALFVGREGFRLALAGEGAGRDEDDGGGDGDDNGGRKEDHAGPVASDERAREQRMVNVSWLSVPIGALLSAIALLMHLRGCSAENATSQNNDEDDDEIAMLDYKTAGTLYCLAALVETLSEPLVIRCLRRMDVAAKARAEGAALVAKSASCFVCLRLVRHSWFVNMMTTMMMAEGERKHEGVPSSSEASFAVTAFGVSQLVYALTLTGIMYRKAMVSKGGVPWPRSVRSSTASYNPYREKGADDRAKTAIKNGHMASSATENFDTRILRLVLIFAIQGLFKHALTEADRIVLSALAGSYDQGVYALAASYGGLAARLLLQPAEENARLLFSQQGALVAAQRDNYADSNGNGNGEKNEKEPKAKYFDLLKKLEDTYFFLLRAVLYVGLIFATIAVNYTSVLLRLLAGSRWGTNAEASAALSAFCVYTAFLALNGITEAFVYGVARSGNDIGRLGVAHTIVGGIFALIAPGMVGRHGAAGLVTANCISMGLRSIYSLHYAREYFARAGRKRNAMGVLTSALPHAIALAMFSISYGATRASRDYIYDAGIAAGASWVVAGAKHIAVGVFCVIITATLSLWLERDIRLALLRLLKRKRD